MKYIYCLLITLVITNNSLSNTNNVLHYQFDHSKRIAPHTLPNNGHNDYIEKMNRLHIEREYRARLDQERRIRNLEKQNILDSVGIKLNVVNYK